MGRGAVSNWKSAIENGIVATAKGPAGVESSDRNVTQCVSQGPEKRAILAFLGQRPGKINFQILLPLHQSWCNNNGP